MKRLFLCTLLLLSSSVAFSMEQEEKVNTIPYLPITLFVPGLYKFDRDLEFRQEGSTRAIHIIHSNIILDLNGKTLKSKNSGVGISIHSQVENVEIRNGIIEKTGSVIVSSGEGKKGIYIHDIIIKNSNPNDFDISLCRGSIARVERILCVNNDNHIITEREIDQPIVLSIPGSYKLDNDIVYTGEKLSDRKSVGVHWKALSFNVIAIKHSNIKLDLNDKVIKGNDVNIGICVNASAKDVEITNGTIENAETAILSIDNNVYVHDIRILTNNDRFEEDIITGPDARVEGIVLRSLKR